MSKLQLRTGDVYENIVTDNNKPIKGIKKLEAYTSNMTVIYSDGRVKTYIFNNQEQLKSCIKIVNKYLKHLRRG